MGMVAADEPFGSTLRRLRVAAGLSQQELAERAGLSPAAVAALERGRRRRPYPATVRALAEAMDLPAEDRARLLLGAAGPDRRAAPAADRPPPAAQLPIDIGDFTGRRAEVAWLEAAVAASPGGDAPTPVVVLTGKAGVGKSTLAVHVGHRLRGRFPNGQLHAALRGTHADAREPVAVLAAFLRALGASTRAAPAEIDELSALYRSVLAERPMLVVLDDARDEAQVTPLLPATPGCAVLVTSRSRLAALPGAALLDLDDLDVDSGVELLAAMTGAERVRREPERATEVVRLCGGLPLSIRIAGATLRARPQLSLGTYASRLAVRQHRLDALRFGDLDVRGSLGLGYEQLPAAARGTLRRLPLLPGADVTVDAVAPLMGWTRDRAEDALERLHESHWLRGVEEGRYRAHDLVLAFAEERLRAEETPEGREGAETRLLDWYAGAASARLEAAPGAHPDETVAWIESERTNLLALARRAEAAGRSVQALEIAVLLGTFAELQESWLSEEEACAIGLRAAGQLGDGHAEVRLLVRRAAFLRDSDRAEDAHLAARGARDLARRLGDRRSEGRALNVLGDLHFAAVRYAEAEACHRESLALLGAGGDRYGEAAALVGLAFDLGSTGRWEEAKACLTRAEGAFRELGHQGGLAYTLTARATAADFMGEWDDALGCARASAAIHRRLRSPWGEFRALNRVGSAALQLARLGEAASAYEAALDIARRRANRLAEVTGLNGLGAVRAAQGRWEAAAALHQAALAAARAIDDRVGAALALAHLALAGARLGDGPRVPEMLDASLDLAREIHVPILMARVLEVHGRAWLAAGRWEHAADVLGRSEALYRSLRFEHAAARVEGLLRRTETIEVE
jgi:transcriptional regulator with XRE-family HTH domain/tetratricopeptide (TPR) repeat protein